MRRRKASATFSACVPSASTSTTRNSSPPRRKV
ncbi:Uncharacterised protein [Bordetella pertussis]|nr:Uncharacterised protein [Bordetella pertussis]